MVTIVDVARRAGVGIATVSRVMNNKGQIREATRARVLAAVDELGYHPSLAARSLRRGLTPMISVVVPLVACPSAAICLRGLVAGLRGTDLPVNILNVDDRDHGLSRLLQLTSSLPSDGAVVVSLHPGSEQLAALSASAVSPVFVDAQVEGFSCVYVDNDLGGLLATRRLIELGHERIGFIGGAEDADLGGAVTLRRRSGYRTALAEAGIGETGEFERIVTVDAEASRAVVAELIAMPAPPTALFVSSDTHAFSIVEAARDAALAVPRDLSVIGFDDIESSRYFGLSTVRQPFFESGLAAADLVIESLEQTADVPRHVELALEVVDRATSGRPTG